ncbi:MAG: hypothetical protein H7282_00535 [Cytophagaceae bacterium]|nr:hypothetical protein [Cytophagaceae bacterium]
MSECQTKVLVIAKTKNFLPLFNIYVKAYDKIEVSKEVEVSNEGWICNFKDYGRTSFYQAHSCSGIEWYLEKAS